MKQRGVRWMRGRNGLKRTKQAGRQASEGACAGSHVSRGRVVLGT